MGHMADPIWPLLLLGVVPSSLGLGMGGWREAPSMAYRTQLNPDEAWWDAPTPLSSIPSEPQTPAWEKKKYLGLTHLPPLFNMFGVQLPPHSGGKQWVARNSGWGGGRQPERRGESGEECGPAGGALEHDVLLPDATWIEKMQFYLLQCNSTHCLTCHPIHPSVT